MKKAQAFTLIELLIVVAIIAILAAIAVPNFLEAQTRAKVSRAMSDMRSLATAIEVYRTDNNQYPDAYEAARTSFFNNRLRQVTTPIAYITSLPVDPFRKLKFSFPDPQQLNTVTFEYTDRRTHGGRDGAARNPTFGTFAGSQVYDNYFDRSSATAWSIFSPGPQFRATPFDNVSYGPNSALGVTRFRQLETYDPTNGTVSLGALWRTNVVTR